MRESTPIAIRVYDMRGLLVAEVRVIAPIERDEMLMLTYHVLALDEPVARAMSLRERERDAIAQECMAGRMPRTPKAARRGRRRK